MKRQLCVLALTAVVVAMPSVASAVDCDYQHIKVDYTRATFIDPPIAPWDVCLHVGKVVGTLNGTYTVCWSLADRIPSTDVYGDTFAQIFAVRYFSRMETKDGIVDFIEWGWYDGDFGLESGFAKVVAGTGPFEDAFGTLSWPPRFPNLGGVVIYEGYICTP